MNAVQNGTLFGDREWTDICLDFSANGKSIISDMQGSVINNAVRIYSENEYTKTSYNPVRRKKLIKSVLRSHPQIKPVQTLPSRRNAHLINFFFPMVSFYRWLMLSTYLPADGKKLFSVNGDNKNALASEYPDFYLLNLSSISDINISLFSLMDRASKSIKESLVVYVTPHEYVLLKKYQDSEMEVIDRVASTDDYLLKNSIRLQVEKWEALSLSMHFVYERTLQIVCLPKVKTLESFLLSSHAISKTVITAKKILESFGKNASLVSCGLGRFTLAIDLGFKDEVISAAYREKVFCAAQGASNMNTVIEDDSFSVMFEAILAGDIQYLSEINDRALAKGGLI